MIRMDSVKENKEGYTTRQQEGANTAKLIYQLISRPSQGDFKTIIKNNMIRICLITVEDVSDSIKIYGRDVYALRGNSVRRRPVPVSDFIAPVPKHILEAQKRVTLCVDVFFDKITVLITAVKR